MPGTGSRPARPGLSLPVKNAILWKDFYFQRGGVRRQTTGVIILAMMMAAFLVYVYNLNKASSRTNSYNSAFDWIENIGYTSMTLGLIHLALVVTLLASRIFHEEIRGKTLSSLVMLPVSIRYIAYQKVGAALLALVPGVLFAGFGALLTIEDWGPDFLRHEEPLLMVFYLFSVLVLVAHVCALLSTALRWGGFVLGITVTAASQIILLVMAVAGSSSGTGAFVGIGMLNGVVSVIFHIVIGTRLEAKAAAD